MGKSITIGLNPGYDLGAVCSAADQQLKAQGFETMLTVMNQNSASLIVKKDRDGFKNFVGLGIECQVSATVFNGNTMTVNIESEWTNKIIAIAIGVFLGWWLLPFALLITGIIGCSNQSSLPNRIIQAFQTAAAGGGMNQQYNQQYQQYQQQQYQQPYQQYQQPPQQ